ncbi:hypothetical protein NL676_019808 [Syzygium grande]|nr:hypothetical protein NL676_019808 [Syzygium grande]
MLNHHALEAKVLGNPTTVQTKQQKEAKPPNQGHRICNEITFNPAACSRALRGLVCLPPPSLVAVALASGTLRTHFKLRRSRSTWCNLRPSYAALAALCPRPLLAASGSRFLFRVLWRYASMTRCFSFHFEC